MRSYFCIESGNSGISTMWITPFAASTSGVTTVAVLVPMVNETTPSADTTLAFSPLTKSASMPFNAAVSAAITLPAITCEVRTVFKSSTSPVSVADNSSMVTPIFSANASNPALVGANTVNGPSPASVSPKPAAVTSATSVLKSGLPAAMSTIVCGASVAGASVVSTAVSSVITSSATVSVVASSVAASSLSLPQAVAKRPRVATAPRAMNFCDLRMVSLFLLWRFVVVRRRGVSGGTRSTSTNFNLVLKGKNVKAFSVNFW